MNEENRINVNGMTAMRFAMLTTSYASYVLGPIEEVFQQMQEAEEENT